MKNSDDDTGDAPTVDVSVDSVITGDPAQIEEFSIREVLGRGGFGTVYLAYDNVLQRDVALKIPHARLTGKASATASYLAEARAIASLDHPSIIPVYRAASTPGIPCYIVTKRISGCHLGQWSVRNHPGYEAIARVLAQVADALAYAHKQGIVHRDVKPGNILVDDSGHPYVADFGLALRDADTRGAPAYIGTPQYMSPEQARGEGHRVDGRSDIFSLGIVMYELLVGHRPFKAPDRVSLLDEILYTEPEYPKQVDHETPTELSRICMKALSKSIGERFQTATLLAEELHDFLGQRSQLSSISRSPQDSTSAINLLAAADSGNTSTRIASTPNVQEPRVIPKGLRPFDVRDADFYLRLLPGPRDREGVPESVRFWVSSLTPSAPSEPLNVGLIYGPSGCGKSSLVRAGIIPRLSEDVSTIYIQASAEDTERSLVSQISKRLSPADGLAFVDDESNVVNALATIRRSRKKRTVIFIDQFEQWLFSHPDCVRQPLTQALRQCDGEHLQCVLMVRDDFWMGVTRLMQALDISVAENVNVTAVDLFDKRHARAVLAMFGAAYGRLPDSIDLLTPAQSRFLDAGVEYLSADGRVVCVQLALLAEMLKNQTWDKSAGVFDDGGAGLGMRFLQDTFESDTSPRRFLAHSEGVIQVLKALLPDSGSRIKGSVRSEHMLLTASGYRDRRQFRELVSILDRELHLITPTDRGDTDSFSGDSSIRSEITSGYQLTHDFLIAPIRQWVEYHNRTTTKGKTQSKLEDFAELYRVHPRPQSLPGLTELAAIRWHCPSAAWTQSQQAMVAAAESYQIRRCGGFLLGLAFVLGVFAFGYRWIEQQNAENVQQAMIQRLLDAKMPEAIQLAGAMRDSESIRESAASLTETESTPGRQVRAALLITPVQPNAADVITNYVFDAPVDEAVELARAEGLGLESTADTIRGIWSNQAEPRSRQLRAACLLVNNPTLSQHFELSTDTKRVVDLLVLENPLTIQKWSEGFQPLAEKLIPKFADRLRVPNRSDDSLNAVNLLATYAKDDLPLLASVIPKAQPSEVVVLAEAMRAGNHDHASAIRGMLDRYSQARHEVDLSRPWGSPWWCVGSRLPIELNLNAMIEPSLVDQLTGYEGIIGKQAVMVHRMPIGKLAKVNDGLESAGYRMAELVPYGSPEDRFLFALWIQDGVPSKFEIDLSADELRSLNNANRDKGFLPDSLLLYRDTESEIERRYACVWIQPPPNGGLVDSDIYVDIPGDRHEQDGWQKLSERALGLPRSNSHYATADNREFFTSVRWRTKNDVAFKDNWLMSRADFSETHRHSPALTPIVYRMSARETNKQESHATPVWWLELPVTSQLVDYQARREHHRRATQWMNEGYFPVSISVTAIDDDSTPQFSSIWWRGLPDLKTEAAESNELRNLAIASFLLGDDHLVREGLLDQQNEELRGAMIAAPKQFNLAPQWLMEQLSTPGAEPILLRSCADALSLYQRGDVPDQLVDEFNTRLPNWLSEATDPGLRSSLVAIGKAWGINVSLKPNTNVDLELNSLNGDRLVVVRSENPAWIGSLPNEPGRDSMKEPRCPVEIDHSFAIATHEITLKQFQEFMPDHTCPENYCPTNDSPVLMVTWFEAVKYCRWLSEREGIPESEMCYPSMNEIGPGMKISRDAINRIGYRLPTEAEWEVACRGGASSGRWFGFDPSRLHHHAWTTENSDYRSHPVESLLPNDYGLFDMLGNAMEWCHEPYGTRSAVNTNAIEDPGRSSFVMESSTRMNNRGGAMLYQPLDARAGQRDSHQASTRWVYITFRIARTVRPEKTTPSPEKTASQD